MRPITLEVVNVLLVLSFRAREQCFNLPGY